MWTNLLCSYYDLDVLLRDGALDPEIRPTQRMIANAAIGMDVEDAYYSVRELREAVEWIHEGHLEGKAKLANILANGGVDDFQRCIYYCLAGRGVVEMLDDLVWLETILEKRGRVAAQMNRAKLPVRPVRHPYVAAEPDGPLVEARPDFSQGRSWWADPTLQG